MEQEAQESPLVLQIRAAVEKRMAPFEIVVAEVDYGQRVMVGVVGIKRVFGYRRFMADGTRNHHTPESFADSLAEQVQHDINRMLAAQAKRDARAAKRVRAG